MLLARDLHMSVAEIDALSAAELRWWVDALSDVRREEARLAKRHRSS